MKQIIIYMLSSIIGIAACNEGPAIPSDQTGLKDVLILVSLDGFRHDYLEFTELPALNIIVSKGIRAKGLIPVFPSKTFPNHYSIVTGLYPDRHGILANTMYDPAFDETFTLHNGASRDGKWCGGEPIWVTAEKQGLISATYFWPGSDAAIRGIRPTYYKKFDGSVPYADRTKQVISWLALPKDKRPDFITLYFQSPDTEGHKNGPNPKGVEEALKKVDHEIDRLLRGIENLKMTDHVNLIIVSDHGMSPISRDSMIFLDDYIDLKDIRTINRSPVADIIPNTGKSEAIFEALKTAHPKMEVYRKGDLPRRLHYNDHPRISPIIAIAHDGWSISDRSFFNAHPNSFLGATHGYDPKYPNMWGIFLAMGPAFKEGIEIREFENIHLYALMCKILDIDPAPNDGRLNELIQILE